MGAPPTTEESNMTTKQTKQTKGAKPSKVTIDSLLARAKELVDDATDAGFGVFAIIAELGKKDTTLACVQGHPAGHQPIAMFLSCEAVLRMDVKRVLATMALHAMQTDSLKVMDVPYDSAK